MSDRDRADQIRRPDDEDVLEAVTRAIEMLESHSDTGVRVAVRTLLGGIDAVHRSGLTHLVEGIHGLAGAALLDRLVADPAIRFLLMSYNLIAVDRRIQAEEAVDTVRGHLHDHGVDVEITGVVGGVVYARLHVPRRTGDTPTVAADAARRDLESALRQGLPGFQELVFGDAPGNAPLVATIPVGALRPAHKPVYFDAGPADLVPGALRAAAVNGVGVLLAAVDGEIYAFRNQCGDSPLPLEFSTLDATVLRCSWHGCRYDVRTGRRIDGDPGRLRVYPVALDAGRIQVALDVEPVHKDR